MRTGSLRKAFVSFPVQTTRHTVHFNSINVLHLSCSTLPLPARPVSILSAAIDLRAIARCPFLEALEAVPLPGIEYSTRLEAPCCWR